MSEPSKAVFLSYASQDAEAARRICEALRAAGIEVWFDQSELRGGDVWDHQIRQQIHDCALFMPIISAHTDERTEGYFRLEWKLAVDRSHLMADDAAFLLPVVIDDTTDAGARVPEKFRTVQWTRLPAGETAAAFSQRVSALLAGTAKPVPASAAAGLLRSAPKKSRPGRTEALVAIGLLAIGAIALFSWRQMARTPAAVAHKAAAPAASKIPEHSIAVLPFADLSARKDQEYFSDGLAEELLNLLSKVPGLQVAARTSAFSFKGHAVDVPTIGRQLMVAHVLEGSVRKVGNHLRVTAQLERADNGYQIWSETYDRELGDVFRIQDEISAAVVKALKVSLLGSAPPRSTSAQNPGAYLVFLQGRAKMASQRMGDIKSAAADFTQTLKLDPNYGPAYVELATAKLELAEFEVTGNRPTAFAAAVEEARLLIEQALALDPNNAQAYVERGYLRAFSDLKGAEQDYRRAIQLNPNSARGYQGLATVIYEDPRRRDEALTLLTKASQLDPLEPKYDVLRATILFFARSDARAADALLTEVVARHPLYQPALMRLSMVKQIEGRLAEAVMYGEQALKLDPLSEWARRSLIYNYVYAGDAGAARRVADEAPHALPIQKLGLLMHDADWRRAADVSYAALADGTMLPIDEPDLVLALRIGSRATGDFHRARVALERLCGVTWTLKGVPTLPTQLGMASASVGLGDGLIASGEREQGGRLLRASLADMDYVAQDLKRGDLWYVNDRAIAAALLGDRKTTLVALRKAVATGYMDAWWVLMAQGMDPAFNAVRDDAEYQTLTGQMRAKLAQQRQLLDRLRAEGRVPDRSGRKGPAALP
jgi:TolB-like protein/Tfp pilus assembly protein PilF